MPEQQSDTSGKIRGVVDSTLAIAFARFLMPIALAVIGWFMVNTMNGFQEKNAELWKYVGKISDVTALHSESIAAIKAHIDSQDKSLDRIINLLDATSRKQ